MKVTVCQMPEYRTAFETAWQDLEAHVREHQSQLVLLPEMPFYRWFPRARHFDASVWRTAIKVHETWLARLTEMAPAALISTRPVEQDTRRLNEGFIWTAQDGYQPAHHKYYLPDEAGFWEASWYQRGYGTFTLSQVGQLRVGLLICTELWFMSRARMYGKQGVHVIANPRATEGATLEKWLVGGRAAAVIAGAYCLSSNGLSSAGESHGLGGQGWIIDPDGRVLGITSPEQPFLTLDIDLGKAERAKQTYPRYVQD